MDLSISISRSPGTLADLWRTEAETLRKRGAAVQAVTLESCADELETALRERTLEALTLNEASRESGYSYSALQKMVANGTVPNQGNSHRPRIRRGDLPRKAGRLGKVSREGEPDLVGRILGTS